jgi:hypothetical protein
MEKPNCDVGFLRISKRADGVLADRFSVQGINIRGWFSELGMASWPIAGSPAALSDSKANSLSGTRQVLLEKTQIRKI